MIMAGSFKLLLSWEWLRWCHWQYPFQEKKIRVLDCLSDDLSTLFKMYLFSGDFRKNPLEIAPVWTVWVFYSFWVMREVLGQ